MTNKYIEKMKIRAIKKLNISFDTKSMPFYGGFSSNFTNKLTTSGAESNRCNQFSFLGRNSESKILRDYHSFDRPNFLP